MKQLALLVVLTSLAPALRAQDVTVEYRVKAAYLFNFAKFVEWPSAASSGPLTICVAGRNPFGQVLQETIRDEEINGRPLAVRTILEPDAGCHVIFVPRGGPAAAYLRFARASPILTVGEEQSFIGLGGIVSLDLEGGNVRFTINPDAAERAGLSISSRLLQLARIATDGGEK